MAKRCIENVRHAAPSGWFVAATLLMAGCFGPVSPAAGRSTSGPIVVDGKDGVVIGSGVTGVPTNITRTSNYLGKSNVFDKAIAAFSIAYADQNEKDHSALKRAIRDGKVEAVIEKAK